MKRIYKLLGILLIILMMICMGINAFYVNTIEADENTLIITQCTYNMRALETGVAVYAGYNHMPLILSDKQIPPQLSNWLPSYISNNHIRKVIVIGNVDARQILELAEMGVEVRQIWGDSISQILTKMADNTMDKNNDTTIFTSSDPLAGLLGAYMKAPVFVTASNSSYESAAELDDNYKNYMNNHNIKNIIVVGNLPENLLNELKQYNATVEILSGKSSADVSIAVNNKLKTMGHITSPMAYYGFYGELPSVIPSAVYDNAYFIEDSSFDNKTMKYLKKNNVHKIILTRNTESDYIQMEETDYISSDIVKSLEVEGFDVSFLTRPRTLDEATGLYDLKINLLDVSQNHGSDKKNTSVNMKSEPPLLSILDENAWIDSNNITVNITGHDNDSYDVKWSTIHPYLWIKNNDSSYYSTSNTGYEYYWTKDSGKWTVDYRYDNKSYYNITWIENDDNTWTEIQRNKTYNWSFDGNTWYCYEDNIPVYTLTRID